MSSFSRFFAVSIQDPTLIDIKFSFSFKSSHRVSVYVKALFDTSPPANLLVEGYIKSCSFSSSKFILVEDCTNHNVQEIHKDLNFYSYTEYVKSFMEILIGDSDSLSAHLVSVEQRLSEQKMVIDSEIRRNHLLNFRSCKEALGETI